jgi:hypothetical protein
MIRKIKINVLRALQVAIVARKDPKNVQSAILENTSLQLAERLALHVQITQRLKYLEQPS